MKSMRHDVLNLERLVRNYINHPDSSVGIELTNIKIDGENLIDALDRLGFETEKETEKNEQLKADYEEKKADYEEKVEEYTKLEEKYEKLEEDYKKLKESSEDYQALVKILKKMLL